MFCYCCNSWWFMLAMRIIYAKVDRGKVELIDFRFCNLMINCFFCFFVYGYLAVCEQDQFGRPTAILINFCNVIYNEDDTSIDYDDQIDLTMHELTHGLIFNRDYFSQFRSIIDGNVISEHEVIEFINNTHWIISPTVRDVAREHFNCVSLPGAMLDYTEYHWSGRMLNTLSVCLFVHYIMIQTKTGIIYIFIYCFI